MKKFVFAILFSISHQLASSQDGNWDVYIAQWDEGPGSVILNMDLINSSPNTNLPFLIVTGVKYKKCDKDGFPEKSEFDKLYEISDSVNFVISKITQSESVGSFTFQCERLDYIYSKDTTGIRGQLEKLYANRFPNYEPYINIKIDSEWKAYREFLYPNEEIMDVMSNEKVLANLVQAGDDLSKPRQVDHWIYFNTSKDRDQFVVQVKKEKFKIEGMEILKEGELPYQLHISRKDNVDPDSINKLTMELRKLAKTYKGDYDGWETFIVK
jgi:uncharacterized protein (TIGR01619 family)